MIMQKFYRLAALASVSLCSLAGVVPAAHAYETVSGGRYGQVTVTRPTGDVRGFVVLFSRESGWNPADQQAADALAKNGAMVVGVDTAKYAANLAAKKEACHQLVGDAEAVSHQLERQVQSSRYFMPIVAGSGQGATLAMQVLKQAPENTVAGAVSVAAQRDLDKRFNPCAPDPTVTHGPGLPGFAETDANASAGTQRIVELTTPHLRVAAMKEEDVSDLPLIELPAAHPTGMMAIVISGDGGWRDLDKTIAEELQKDGVSVIGWDSLRYFWSERSPQQTSNDLARVLKTYTTRWHADHVALIGYSFGADVMPFAYNRLPDAVRAKVALISLLGFAPSADFQIRVTGWLGMPASDKALQVKPELARLPPKIVQCFYGEHEEDTLCPTLTKTGVEVIRTSGDHHFGHDYAALEKHILGALKKQAGGT
ncbi:virulence factor family protein [Paraburkholderia caribensis]|uniref:virulence factor family protein n=1 Tax=Paraburkholderia caribensis TaxID=75105 RepID=UPI00071FE3DE|nr:AcvB/VirJ family lysyl-phosphatidylglycerol hydrolase [Paraburkholderia caribensis]ALP65111.1 virulence factor [Paraburkholderia caribensis]AMV44470.1 virulence factor [Paraburkholderia caribensis]AUT53740.1 virulence factor family protein [Paraburkholderia caribensis]